MMAPGKEFNLVYRRVSDDRIFLVYAVTKVNYVLFDTVTKEKSRATQGNLRGNYYPDKRKNKANKKNGLFKLEDKKAS